jgi:hypothetical protein
MAQASADALPTKGSLKRTPFAKLMRALGRASATGSLYLLKDDTKKVVFFQDGTPVFVRSNVLEECLGQILAAEGLITQGQCDQTLEAIRRTGKKQGELLVEMGILSQGNLRYGLEAQLQRKLFDIFTWSEGRFQFKPGPGKKEHSLGLDTNTPALIAGGVLGAANLDAANDALKVYEARFPLAKSSLLGTLSLLPTENHFLACLDGSREAAKVIDAQDDDNRDEAVLLLHALVSAGAVSLPKAAREAAEVPEAPLDHSARPDSDFLPDYAPTENLKGYEDTPLPGQLPEPPAEISGTDVDVDDEFDSVVEESEITPIAAIRQQASAEIDQALIDAEPEELVDEAFDAEIEVLDDEELELIEEDDFLEEIDEEEEQGALPSIEDASAEDLGDVDDDLVMDAEADSDLLDLDELDDLALDGDLEDVDLDADLPPEEAEAVVEDEGADSEMLGAMKYAEGEAALQAGEWESAAAALEIAYDNGVDMAELHAMLAYARFKTAEQDPDMAQHALELLEYSESMNPNLDVIYAYRGEIYLIGGHMDAARESIEHALHLNEYSDLAMQLMDRIS